MKLQDSAVQKHYPIVGIIFVLCACLANALMATSVKQISTNYSVSSSLLVCIRFSLGFLFCLPLLLKPSYRPIRKTLTIHHWQPHAIRICFGLLTINAYFYAIQTIPLSSAVLLIYTSPLFIPFILKVWKKSSIAPKLWWGLLVGFLGVFLILGPAFNSLSLGYFIGLTAGLNAGICYVAARLQSYNDRPFCINFYFFLFSALGALALSYKNFSSLWAQLDLRLCLYLLWLGISGTLFQTFIILAVKWAQIRFLSAFLYFTVAFAMLLDWVLFAKQPTFVAIGGLALISLGATLMTLLDPMRKQPDSLSH